MIERERVQYSKRITVATSFLKALGFVKQIPNKPHVAVWTSDNPLEKWRGKREYELFLKSSNDSTTPISLDDTSKYAPELFSLSKQRALKSINFQMVVDKVRKFELPNRKKCGNFSMKSKLKFLIEICYYSNPTLFVKNNEFRWFLCAKTFIQIVVFSMVY